MKPEPVNRPKRPAIRWHGGKWRMAKWIMGHFPPHDLYVEPFGGSAAVLLQKPRSNMEVYNDLDLNIWNFFNVLRTSPSSLIQEIKLTPFHSYEFDQAGELLDVRYHTEQEIEEDEVEWARLFYVYAYQSILGPTVEWTNSFKRQKIYSRGASGKSSMKPTAHTFAEVDHLYTVAARLKGVTFENMDAFKLIDHYDHPNTLFYLDPPYLASTRSQKKNKAYNHEMMSREEHKAFLRHAKGLQGIPLISGYASDLYRDMLEDSGWTRFEYNARINGGGIAMECLWLSPRAEELRTGSHAATIT